MRSFIVVSVACVVGCSAAPSDPISEDAGKVHVLPSGDGGADAADAAPKADAHVEASGPKPTPSCPSVPEDESGYQAKTPPKVNAASNACGAGQLTGMYNACLSTAATTTSCNNWKQSSFNATCAQCVVSTQNTTPVVSMGTYITLNLAGCVEVVTQNPAPPGSCGYAVYQEVQCYTDACNLLCPTDYSFELVDFNTCETNADNGTCKPLADAANTACDTDGGVYAKCFEGDSFEELYLNVASTFCGGS